MSQAIASPADALARQGTLSEQLAAENDLVAAAQDSVDLANARYTQGVGAFLTALTSLQNRVTLYKVLGDGSASASWRTTGASRLAHARSTAWTPSRARRNG
jgi:hypothetical protein